MQSDHDRCSRANSHSYMFSVLRIRANTVLGVWDRSYTEPDNWPACWGLGLVRAKQRHTRLVMPLALALGIGTRPLDVETNKWKDGPKTELTWTVACPPARGIPPGLDMHGLKLWDKYSVWPSCPSQLQPAYL